MSPLRAASEFRTNRSRAAYFGYFGFGYSSFGFRYAG